MEFQLENFFLQTDSRKVKQGDLFVALKGNRVDGHDFLELAASQGATHALVREDYRGAHFGLTLLRVDDPFRFVQQAARKKVERQKPTLIAITGSIGKTSTKEFLFTILSKKFAVAKTHGNQNSQVGLPISLLNDWKSEPVLIVEMGMSALHQIASLVQIAPPDIALITEIAPVHIESLKTIDNIVQAKGEIFDHPRTRFGIIKKGVYGEKALIDRGTCHKILAQKEERRYPIPLLANHLVENFHLACLVGELLGVPKKAMQEAAKNPPLIPGRFHKIQAGAITFIDDAYNACELSMISALSNLPSATRKIAVLGEMMELGAHSHECHKRVGKSSRNSRSSFYCR